MQLRLGITELFLCLFNCFLIIRIQGFKATLVNIFYLRYKIIFLLFSAFPEYVLTAVDGFTLNNKTTKMDATANSDLSDEKIQGHWEIKSRNELIVTEHQSSSEYVLY